MVLYSFQNQHRKVQPSPVEIWDKSIAKQDERRKFHTRPSSPPPKPADVVVTPSGPEDQFTPRRDREKGQRTIEFYFKGQKPMSNNEFHLITARYICMCSLAFEHVEDPGFKDFVIDSYGEEYMTNNELTFPTARMIATRIEQLYERDRRNLMRHLKAALYVCTTSDIWTGFHRGFLGVTAHWIDPETLERRTAALAFRWLSSFYMSVV